MNEAKRVEKIMQEVEDGSDPNKRQEEKKCHLFESDTLNTLNKLR